MPNTRSPKKPKSPEFSDSDEESVAAMVSKQGAGGSADSSTMSGGARSRSLRARKTWNYAKMLQSNSEVSDDSDDDGDDSKRDADPMRPRRQRRKRTIAGAGNVMSPGRSSVGGSGSANDALVRSCRRNLAERRYVENTDSGGATEDDDEDDLNISLSVSSRGRIRRLTAKARARVLRD